MTLFETKQTDGVTKMKETDFFNTIQKSYTYKGNTLELAIIHDLLDVVIEGHENEIRNKAFYQGVQNVIQHKIAELTQEEILKDGFFE